MTTVLNDSQSVRTALENLQILMEQLRGQFVHGIKNAADYDRATVLLDELTDGHELNKYEDQILVELEDAILAYERDSRQFKAFNASFSSTSTPIQLIKDLMETLQLTGSDLPEIGDKTAVSKVLNGERAISPRMAFALAERFHIDPKAFIKAPAKPRAGFLQRNTDPRPAGRPSLKLQPSAPALTPKPTSKPSYPVPMRDDNRLAASARKPGSRGPKA